MRCVDVHGLALDQLAHLLISGSTLDHSFVVSKTNNNSFNHNKNIILLYSCLIKYQQTSTIFLFLV